MRRYLPILGLAIAVSSCGKDVSLPKTFEGAWDLETAACADPESLSGLRVTSRRLQFYESTGDLIRTTGSDDGVTDIELDWTDASVTAPGGLPLTERKVSRLSLSEDQSRLSILIDDENWTYVRCPGE